MHGALGGVSSLVLGRILATTLTRSGIMMPPPPTFTSGFLLRIEVVPVLYAWVLGLMIVTLGAAALRPAAPAARLLIVDALGHI